MSHRKVNIPRLIFVIVIAIFIVVLFGVTISSCVDRAERSKDTSAATPTPISTPTPTADFYTGDDDTTPTPSAESTAKNDSNDKDETLSKKEHDEMLENVKKQTDQHKQEISKQNRTDNDQTNNNGDVNGLSLQKSFGTVNIRNGITINAKANSGTLAVVMTDASGKQSVVFKQNGPFNQSQSVTLPSGKYNLDLYGNASGWSWSYNLY